MAVQFDVTLNGLGLNDFGLYGNSVDGIGLNTFGFVWSCAAIWNPCQNPVTTTWVDCDSYVTNIETCVGD